MRVDGIGDALACTPLIAALKEAGHALSALLCTANAQIFAERAFENVHVVERIPWPKHGYTPQTWHPALQAARRASYDIALVASEEPQAYTFAKGAGIAQRIGFYNGWQKPFKSWWARGMLTRAIYRPAAQPPHPRHEVETLFALGSGLHRESEPTRDPARLRPLVLDDDIVAGDASTVQITRKWLHPSRPAQNVRAWFAALNARGAWSGICSEDERDLGERLGEAAGMRVAYFADVRSWKEALARSAHILTPDTGAAHVAGMLGIPCTDFFEDERYEAQVLQWAPWAAQRTIAKFPAQTRRG